MGAGKNSVQAEAALLGRDAAEQITLSNYVNASSFSITYPEDLDLYGFTFSTTTPITGTLLTGEISYHPDYPFQRRFGPTVNAVLSPVLFDPDAGTTTLGSFGPDEVINGVATIDRTQVTLEAAQIFRGLWKASEVLVSGNIGWMGLDDIPGDGETPLDGTDDDNAWGYRIRLAANYNGLLGGINVSPFTLFSHDVSGTTPTPLAGFIEDRKSLTLGVSLNYINRITSQLQYTSFFDGGPANRLRDRDYIRFQVSYYL